MSSQEGEGRTESGRGDGDGQSRGLCDFVVSGRAVELRGVWAACRPRLAE